MKTSSSKKTASKSSRPAPGKKAAVPARRKVTKKAAAPARAKVTKKAAAPKRREATKKVAATKRKVKETSSSVLTAFEESVKQGVEALRKTGRDIKEAITAEKKPVRRRKSQPPILLGAMGIDLPPIKAPKPRSKKKT